MFAPNVSTHQLADAIHQERLADAAAIRQAKAYRASHNAMLHQAKIDRGEGIIVDRHAQRGITARRLTATLVGAVLTFAVAAAVAANQPAAAPAAGPSSAGGLTVIR